MRTIEDLAEQYQAPANRQIKTLVYFLDGVLTLVLMRGDHALHEQKLADATGAVPLRPAQPEEIREALGALPGSLGAVGTVPPGSGDHPVIADEALRGRRGMYTGANIDDTHLRGVDVERDIAVGRWADLRQVAAGEAASTAVIRCSWSAASRSAISSSSATSSATPSGSACPAWMQLVWPIMGCYGIGVERAMATAIEVHHDAKGIIWPGRDRAVRGRRGDRPAGRRRRRRRGGAAVPGAARPRRRGHRGRQAGPGLRQVQRRRTGRHPVPGYR